MASSFKKMVLVLALTAGLVTTFVPFEASAVTTYSCSASTGAALLDVPGATPKCSMEVLMVAQAFVSLDVNGTGLVGGSMSFTVVAAAPGTQVFWFTPTPTGGKPASPPSCGLTPFQCSAGTQNTGGVFAGPQLGVSGGQAVVRINCFGGGVAAFESVSCSAIASD